MLGIAMGCRCGPSLANLYLYILEFKWIDIHRPLGYFRFIDDIFLISENEINLNEFKQQFDYLKLKILNSDSVNFLDLNIMYDCFISKLKFRLFIKPTYSGYDRKNLEDLRVRIGKSNRSLLLPYKEKEHNDLNPFLVKTFFNFDPEDIFNCDESVLYFCCLPSSTVAKKEQQVSGFKKIKSRVTFLMCCNLSGSEKKDLLIVGKSKNPRCFPQNKSIYKPFNYVNSENAWMTAKLFIEWLTNWDKILIKKGRKIALLLDNAPCHPKIDTLKNIKLFFLPPNTTSIAQPLDQGIVSAVKTIFRSKVLNELVIFMEKNPNWTIQDWVKNWNLWKALNILAQSWELINISTIVNSWKKAGINLYDCVSSDEEQVVNIVSDVLKDDEFKEYVHVDDNIDIFGPMPSDLELCEIDVEKDINEEDDDIEDALNNNDEQIVTFFEAKDCINKIRQFLVSNGCLDYRA
ncbi:unnamed protein product, partial [Brachionus calyciflorus]